MTAEVINSDGTLYWVENGELNREDGPALIWPGELEAWYKHGQLHREDGPAIIHKHGGKFWYLNGVKVISYEDLQKRSNCSDSKILYLKLKYGEM